MYNQLKNLKPYAILLLILIVAYLPVSTFYFGMKNDAFSDNFPNKFFLTEAIRSGHLPLWNPYINFGFPVYADMGFAFYNPITWLFALIGYNAYMLTVEVLLYIYLAGVFMLNLGRYLNWDKKICLVTAAMYMCCGFYTGCLQYINFLTAAAFLPLAVQALLQLLNGPSFKSSFIFAVACYFVFAGGHPAIPIAFVYFIIILILLLFFFYTGYRNNARKIAISLATALMLCILFYLPAIYSYANILPFYGRNAPPEQILSTQAGFTFSSYLSFLFPFSTVSTNNIFNTDVAMRSGFFSVVGFVCVVLSVKSKQKYVAAILLTALCMLLLSAGGDIKIALFSKLPLLGYVRYNGEYRVFGILCFCIIAGFGMQQLKNGDKVFTRRFKISLAAIACACICIVVTLIATRYITANSLVTLFKQPLPFAQKVKLFLAGPFPWFLMASAGITLLVSTLALLALRKNKFNLLLAITIADLILNSIIYLPVTGVGQVTLKNIQSVYDRYPKGIPIPALVPVNKIDTFNAVTTGLVGDATYYNKLIGTTKLTDYPSYFTSTNRYFNNKQLVGEASRNPYLFLEHGSGSGTSVVVKKFSPENIEITVNAQQDDTLVYLQNNYKFWHATVNGNQVPVTTAYQTFMGVKINKGVNSVTFYYEDAWLGICLLVSLATFIIGVVSTRRSFKGKQTMQNQ